MRSVLRWVQIDFACAVCRYFERSFVYLNLILMTQRKNTWLRLMTMGSKSKTGADFRSRESEPNFRTCVVQKRLRFLTPVRTCSVPRSKLRRNTWSK